VATLAMHYACVVVAASDGGDRAGGDRPPSRPDARKSSSQTCIEPDTETTALAIVRDTPLSPLMGRLRQKHREFHYPEIGLTLRLNQRWDAAGAGTGAAVWDSAELLARYMATSGAARAFNPDALKDDAEAAGAGAGSGSGSGSSSSSPSKTKMHSNAAALARDWWADAVVVELGGGLGLSSMVAAKMGARVLCTDGDDLVVEMCARNVKDNAGVIAGEMETTRLLWGDEEDAATVDDWVAAQRGIEPRTSVGKAKAYPDILLLADVVYGEHPEAWRGLVRTLSRLSGPGTMALLSHTRRGDGRAQRVFFDWLRDAGFVVEAVERWQETRDGFTSLTLLYRVYRYGSTTLGRSYSVVK
jgi:predicted nicotinamide N-methyase